MRLVAIATAALIAATAGAPVAHADPAPDPDPDDQYLANLKQNHIAYSEPSAAENLGRSLCFAIRGQEPMWMILRIVQAAGTYNPHDSAVIVGASVNAYCPEYLPFIKQYAQDHPDG